MDDRQKECKNIFIDLFPEEAKYLGNVYVDELILEKSFKESEKGHNLTLFEILNNSAGIITIIYGVIDSIKYARRQLKKNKDENEEETNHSDLLKNDEIFGNLSIEDREKIINSVKKHLDKPKG